MLPQFIQATSQVLSGDTNVQVRLSSDAIERVREIIVHAAACVITGPGTTDWAALASYQLFLALAWRITESSTSAASLESLANSGRSERCNVTAAAEERARFVLSYLWPVGSAGPLAAAFGPVQSADRDNREFSGENGHWRY